jgi:hypothetical protein
MTVPEAALDENDLAMPGKYDVRASWKVAPVQAEPVAHAVEH